MKINLYNSQNSKLGMNTESTYIQPYLVMADKIMCNSIASEAILIYKYLDGFPEIFILAFSMSVNSDKPEEVERAKEMMDMLPHIKKIRSIKHKDKRMLTMLGTFKQLLGYFKDDIREFYKESMIKFHLLELLPFVDTELWDVETNSPEFNPKTESKLISGIAGNIVHRDAFLSLDLSIENMFRFATLDSPDHVTCDFLKIPLWTFPPITTISHDQMKFTIEQLKPAFEPFKKQIQELSNQIVGLTFTRNNLSEIKKECADRLIPLKENVQKEINESMYLSSLKNSYPGNFGVEFCVGISSAETIINYFEKNKIIEPYMASEIKDRVSKQADIKASHIFTYFDLHGANKDD
jgi:hypothetical protein